MKFFSRLREWAIDAGLVILASCTGLMLGAILVAVYYQDIVS